MRIIMARPIRETPVLKGEDEHTRLMYFDMMEIADWFHITNTPYAMPHRERLNNANGAKRVTDSFGHSNIFATLSVTNSQLYIIKIAGIRA